MTTCFPSPSVQVIVPHLAPFAKLINLLIGFFLFPRHDCGSVKASEDNCDAQWNLGARKKCHSFHADFQMISSKVFTHHPKLKKNLIV